MAAGRKQSKVPINGDRLKELLGQREWTQSKLAMKVSVTRETISKSISSNMMDQQLLDNVCKTLNVSRDYVTGKANFKADSLFHDIPAENRDWFTLKIRTDSAGVVIDPYSATVTSDETLKTNRLFLAWVDTALKGSFDILSEDPSAKVNITQLIFNADDIALWLLQEEIMHTLAAWAKEQDLPTSLHTILTALGTFNWRHEDGQHH